MGGLQCGSVKSSLAVRVAATILRYNMLPRGRRVGVAVSGGADSICLLALLRDLAAAHDWQLTVLHFDHGLRGAESAADAAFVRETARRAGLAFAGGRARSPRLTPPNLEEKARQARYAFFARMARRHQLQAIATAHSLNDQAETVLLRLVRGAGPSGLAGIAPVAPLPLAGAAGVTLVRPLLEIERQEIEAWLGGRGLEWREDSSNGALIFDRNRVRHQLLPLLEREFNPAITRLLGRLAELCAVEERFWNGWAAEALRSRTLLYEPGRLVLDTSAVARLHPAEQRRLLRLAVETVKGDLRQIDHAHLAKLVELCKPGLGAGSARLPGLGATRSFGQLLLATPEAWEAFSREKVFSVTVRRSGQWVAIPGGPGRLRIRLAPARASTGYNTNAGSAPSSMGPPWAVRNWEPGDAYRPTGYRRPYKLKDLFQTSRVPSWDRPGWPIIMEEANGRILWSRRFGLAAEASSALIVDESGS